MSSLKHLLIVTPGFPKDKDDTSCLPAVQQFILCYKKLHPEITFTIISLHYPFDQKHYCWNGMEVYSLRGQNKNGIRRGGTILRAIRKGLSVNRTNNIDAVLAFWLTDAALAAKYISRSIHAPILIWMHGQDAKAGNKYVSYVHPAPDDLAAISDHQNEVFKKAHGFKAGHIIYNGVNKNIFPALNFDNRDIDLLSVGSLIPLKRQHMFIELVQQLKATDKNIKAVVAGEGILQGELTRQIKEAGLDDNITLTGGINHEAVLKLMNRAKILVHTSEYEGHSTVMLEALYSGCYVLSFLPIAGRETENFILCKDTEDMLQQCKIILSKHQVARRVLVSDMEDRAEQMHHILTSKLSHADNSRS